ncbi:hypothetical protein NL676_022889 [Syzygium grande]|nr:hypothetical protein NL676_022889 [Syzygium grande]
MVRKTGTFPQLDRSAPFFSPNDADRRAPATSLPPLSPTVLITSLSSQREAPAEATHASLGVARRYAIAFGPSPPSLLFRYRRLAGVLRHGHKCFCHHASFLPVSLNKEACQRLGWPPQPGPAAGLAQPWPCLTHLTSLCVHFSASYRLLLSVRCSARRAPSRQPPSRAVSFYTVSPADRACRFTFSVTP